MSYGFGSEGTYYNDEPWGNTKFGPETIGRASSVGTPSYTPADFKRFKDDQKQELIDYNKNTYSTNKKPKWTADMARKGGKNKKSYKKGKTTKSKKNKRKTKRNRKK
jgi:hypothetical protein